MTPLYKIFLVEDEIVTRESIRDRVDWGAAGFVFSGEAPDGEIALPQIQQVQPDVLITDIKMPFMNGLELCKIIHETMPQVKTIILSGHDEFDYAREAIKLGVTEYLLKPISAQDFLTVLLRVANFLDREQVERAQLRALQEQMGDTLSLMQEKFLQRLMAGEISSVEAIRQSMQLKLSLIARWYRVIFIRTEYAALQPDTFPQAMRTSEAIITEVTQRFADALIFKKGMQEVVILLKGDRAEHLEQDSYLLMEAIKEEMSQKTRCQVKFGLSDPCEHIGDLSRAFYSALENLSSAPVSLPAMEGGSALKPIELTRLDPSATETYLRNGTSADFEAYFRQYTRLVSEDVLKSHLFLSYLLIDVIISAAGFIHELGGDPGKVIPELAEATLSPWETFTLEQTRAWIQKTLGHAHYFRDHLAGTQYGALIAHARDYMDHHFEDPEMSLKRVAHQVNLSTSHFSVIFSRETGGTFIEYLTHKRMERAKSLLTTTLLRAAEIAEQVGYDNPHYFSTVFKKMNGLTPMEYRMEAQSKINGKKGD